MTWSTRGRRPSARLRAAVKGAYRTFAHYSPGQQLATCQCDLCLEAGVQQRLLTTPPRNISFRLLSEYTWALSGSDKSKFNADEYRHFLPRYFHFIAYGLWPNHSGDWQPTLRGLGVHAYRKRWPISEVDLIDEYFDALLEGVLQQPIQWSSRSVGSEFAYSEVSDLLNTLAIAGASMDRLTTEWGRHLSGPGLRHAACLIQDRESSGELGQLRNELPGAGWDECQSQASILKSWLYRPEIARLFQTASDAEPHPLTRDLLRRAAEAVEGRQTPGSAM